jgi:hypothetical protein
MTTIVVDQEMGFMAADRMITSNDGEYAIPCETKIFEVKIGGDLYLVGLAGLEGSGEYFLNWFRTGEWDEPPEPIYDIYQEDDFTAVVLGPAGIEIADKFCLLTPIQHRWYGAGTGGPIAWAILEAGCGIQKAMETAIRLDPNSGFGYEVKRLDGSVETVDS